MNLKSAARAVIVRSTSSTVVSNACHISNRVINWERGSPNREPRTTGSNIQATHCQFDVRPYCLKFSRVLSTGAFYVLCSATTLSSTMSVHKWLMHLTLAYFGLPCCVNQLSTHLSVLGVRGNCCCRTTG